MDLDLRQLERFVAVAEELHYRRAAQRLGMAQPPLSQSILRLEEALKVQLFARNNRRVALTPAGAALLDEARRLLAQAETAQRIVRQTATGQIARLRVGFVPWSVMRILPRALHEFRRKWPGVEVRLDEQMSKSQVEALREARLDLGILNRSIVSLDGLEVRTIERTRLVAAMPSRWPIARRKSVKLAELAEFPFVLFPEHWVPNYYASFAGACRQAGFEPKVAQQVGQPYTMFNLVANGFGIGLVQDSARHMKVVGVKLVPVEDLPDRFWTEIALAWMPKSLAPPHKALIELLEKQARLAAPKT